MCCEATCGRSTTTTPAEPNGRTQMNSSESASGADALSVPVPVPVPDPDRVRERFAMVHPLRVRWAEADMQGVVFNAHYLAYFDVAITEYWRVLAKGETDWLHQTLDRIYVVKSTIEFHGPARFDDELVVAARCTRLGRASLSFDFEIRRGADHLVTGQSIYVHAQEGRSVPIPEDLRRRIHSFEPVPPL